MEGGESAGQQVSRGVVCFYSVGVLWRWVRTFAFGAARLVLLSTANILLVVRLVCCLKLCGHVRARGLSIKGSRMRFKQRLPPLSIIVYTQGRSRGLHHGLPAVLGRSCPSFRMVIVGSNSASRDRSLLSTLRRRCPGLCRDFAPSDTQCVDQGGLTLALKVGTDGRS